MIRTDIFSNPFNLSSTIN